MLIDGIKRLLGRKTKKEAKSPPDLSRFLKEVEYWLDFSPKSGEAGRWLSKELGSGLDFEELVSFLAYPVANQIDQLATARTLSPVPLVRVFQETHRINVVMVADLSRSMVFGSYDPKAWILAKLAVMLNYTAYRFGDKFGFYGCDEKLIPELVFPPQRFKTYGLDIGSALLNFQPSKNSAQGLLDALPLLPSRKSLVILASDFRLPARSIEEILALLTLRHQVVAFVLRDSVEENWPSKFLGLVDFNEIEGSGKKTLFFSPKAAKLFADNAKQEKKELEEIFKKFDLLPVYLSAVDDKEISKNFEERGRR